VETGARWTALLTPVFVQLLPKPHDLLKFAVEAHGGLSRWNQLNFVKADVSITETI
jgi:hypothetical protein